jgi:hypothetical protein
MTTVAKPRPLRLNQKVELVPSAQFARWHELASAAAALSELDHEISEVIAERYRRNHIQGFAFRLTVERMAAHLVRRANEHQFVARAFWWNWRCLGSSRFWPAAARMSTRFAEAPRRGGCAAAGPCGDGWRCCRRIFPTITPCQMNITRQT